MRSSALGLLALLAILAANPMAAASGDHSATVPAEALRFYVHDFNGIDDPDATNFTMNRTEPTGETPETETCLVCAGDPSRVFTFRTDAPLSEDLDLKAGAAGVFAIWIRAYQPEDGAAFVPAGETVVRFRLAFATGLELGTAEVTKNVTGSDPVEFRGAFAPAAGQLPAGSELVWTVEIASTQKTYNPAAAPYGVSEQNPFVLQFTKLIPAYGTTLQLHTLGGDVARVVTGQAAAFNFTVDNHGEQNTTVTLTPDRVPEGASAGIERPEGSHVNRPVRLAPHESQRLRISFASLDIGNHTVGVRVESSKGETGSLLFLVEVVPADIAIQVRDGGKLPAFEFSMLLAAVAFLLGRRRTSG